MSAKNDLPITAFASREDWDAWLAAHHSSARGLWLKIAKKASGIETVSYSAALDTAICYGWIDGQKDRFDDDFYLQRFTPRRPRSRWSKVNRARAVDLIERGEMRAAGLREVERARSDGRWEAAYASPSNARVPDDLRHELERHPPAEAFFASLDSANRYAILYRLEEAKRPETRARRIAKYVAMLAEQQKFHP